MAGATGLSKYDLETHNQQLRKPRSQSHPETPKPSPNPFKRLLGASLMEQRSRANTFKKSDSGSGDAQSNSLTTLLKLRRTFGRWKGSKMSSVSLNCRDRQVALENNYRMEPDDDATFRGAEIRAIINDAFEYHLGSLQEYDRNSIVRLSPVISDELKSKVKALGFKRYKIVAHVVIGENIGQGFQVASRGVWDTSTDRMVTGTYENKNLFAVATVFGTYFE